MVLLALQAAAWPLVCRSWMVCGGIAGIGGWRGKVVGVWGGWCVLDVGVTIDNGFVVSGVCIFAVVS